MRLRGVFLGAPDRPPGLAKCARIDDLAQALSWVFVFLIDQIPINPPGKTPLLAQVWTMRTIGTVFSRTQMKVELKVGDRAHKVGFGKGFIDCLVPSRRGHEASCLWLRSA